jgi:hypothetical protein
MALLGRTLNPDFDCFDWELQLHSLTRDDNTICDNRDTKSPPHI